MEHLASTTWSDVDRTQHSSRIIDYLDLLRSQPPFQRMKERTFEWMLEAGPEQILDVGCGTGADVIDLAERLKASGTARVVGVDRSRDLVTEARSRADAADLSVSVEFRTADATDLDFPDATFDAVRTDRVLQHLDQPEQGLLEMIRVTRPGGRVVISDVDHGGLMVDCSHPMLMQRIHHFVEAALTHPWIGRRLPVMFRDAGLSDLRVDVQVAYLSFEFITQMVGLSEVMTGMTQAGVFTKREAGALAEDLNSRGASGRWYAGIPVFIVHGRTVAS